MSDLAGVEGFTPTYGQALAARLREDFERTGDQDYADAAAFLAELSRLRTALEEERTRIANAVIQRYATSKSSGSWSMLAEDTARFITMLPPPDIAREALRHALEGEKT